MTPKEFDNSIPVVRRFAGAKLHWDLLKNGDADGSRRGVYSGVAASNCTANLMVVPPGQQSPRHSWEGEHIIIQLEGETWFEVDGFSPEQLKQYDMMFVPADVPYAYRNPGGSDSVFVSIVGRLSEWPAGGQYFE